MVDRAHSASNEDNITGVLLMDIKAAFPSVARGRLIHAMNAKGIDGNLIRWTASFLSDRTVEKVIQGNVLQSHSMEAGVLQGSPVSLILFAMHTAELIKWTEQTVQGGKGLSFIYDLTCVATGNDANQVVLTLEACAGESIEWASRRDIQFDTAKTEAALFTCRGGHKNHLRPKLTVRFKVGDGFVRFNKETTRLLGVWMDAHLISMSIATAA